MNDTKEYIERRVSEARYGCSAVVFIVLIVLGMHGPAQIGGAAFIAWFSGCWYGSRVRKQLSEEMKGVE